MKFVLWLAYWLALFLVADFAWIKGWFTEITVEQTVYLTIIPVLGGIFYERLRNYRSKKTNSSVWKNGYITSLYSGLLWIILWGFAFLIEWRSGLMSGVLFYIHSLGRIIPIGIFMPTGSFIPIGGIAFPWVHRFISKNKTKRTNTTLLLLSCLIISIFVWFCCSSFLNYALPCGDTCTPTHFHDLLFFFAIMYSMFFPLLLAPILAVSSLLALLITLFVREQSHLRSHG